MQNAIELTKSGWEQINLLDGSFRWIVIKTYSWAGSPTDEELISALVAHPSFRDHYCAPGDESEVDAPIHGPYRLEVVTVDRFASSAQAAIANQFDDWLRESVDDAGDEEEAREVEQAIAPARSVLALGDSWYALEDLGESARHEWGFVLWYFREWLVIERAASRLHTVVCGLD